jgi:hypothetical protein
MKCEIFESSSTTTLKREINEWLDLHKDITIVTIQYSTSMRSEYSTLYSCILFYKELKEVRKDKLDNLNSI